MTLRELGDLRYSEWEYTRRLEVEEQGGGDLGYVHLRAMRGRNFTEWAKGCHPVSNRKGLIEGHGVEPDIVVDNLPHATFEDLEVPSHPDKSFDY